MNKNLKRVLAVAIASGLALGTVGTTQASAKKKVRTVTLAFQGSLTGPAAFLGTDALPGAKFAIAEYNATNPKRKVIMILADSQCDPAVATNVAAGVAVNKQVVGVIGTSCSGAARNSFPSYIAAGMPMVSPSATAADLTDPKEPSRGYPIFHRVVANDNFQGPASVRAAVRGVTDPKVYMVDDQTTYGDGIAKNAKPVIKKMATLVGTESVPQKTADYSSVTSKVKASGANVVLYMGYTEDAAKFFKSLRDGGYKGIIAAPDGVLTSDFPDLAGTAAEGVRLVAPDVPFDLAVSKEKLAAFTEATGVKVPGLYVTTSYDAANVFISCFKKGKYNRPGIQNCITNGTFESASGKSLKFNRFGDLIGAVDVGEYLVKNGKIAYIGLA